MSIKIKTSTVTIVKEVTGKALVCDRCDAQTDTLPESPGAYRSTPDDWAIGYLNETTFHLCPDCKPLVVAFIAGVEATNV